MTNFISTCNKGFQMTFENGWTISVQFGYGNYCTNRNHPDKMELHNQEMVPCPDAEVMIWDKNNVDYEFSPSQYILAYATTNEVAEWIAKVSHPDFGKFWPR
jgi:hypothetical protein